MNLGERNDKLVGRASRARVPTLSYCCGETKRRWIKHVTVECIGHLPIDWYLTYIEIGGSIFRYSDRSFVRLRHGASVRFHEIIANERAD